MVHPGLVLRSSNLGEFSDFGGLGNRTETPPYRRRFGILRGSSAAQGWARLHSCDCGAGRKSTDGSAPAALLQHLTSLLAEVPVASCCNVARLRGCRPRTSYDCFDRKTKECRYGSKSRDVGRVSQCGLGRSLARRPGETPSLRAASATLCVGGAALGGFRCPTAPVLCSNTVHETIVQRTSRRLRPRQSQQAS